MRVSFNGFDERLLTLESDGAIKKGGLVKMSGSGRVTLCNDGDNFIGIAVNSEEDACSVQLGGYINMPYSGTAPGVGYARLACDASGKICTAESGREYLVLDVDEINRIIGFIL